MFKSWLITILAVLLLAAAYYFNLFGLLATKGALILGLILVAGVLLAAFFILGNPLANRKDNE